MKLEEMFWHELDRAIAKETIKILKTTNARTGMRKTDLETYLKNLLGTTYVFSTIGGILSRLAEEEYVKRKKFTWKDYKLDGNKEVPRYYLMRKGKKLYKELCSQ